jgi:spermidine/putrescine-binding protein
MRRAGTFAVAILTTTALAAAPAAQASDKGLVKIVVRHEKRVTPLAKAFAKADKALSTATDTNSASAATGKFRDGLHAFKIALTPIKTDTATAAAAKKGMLTAIREYDLGLVQYQKLLDQVSAGASKDSLKSTFETLNKRIDAAADDESAAIKLLKKL